MSEFIEAIKRWWFGREMKRFCFSSGSNRTDKRLLDHMYDSVNNMKPFIIGRLPADEPDANGDIYSKDVLQRALKEFKEGPSKGIGSVRLSPLQPPDLHINRENAAADLLGVRPDSCEVEIVLLDTPAGNMAQSLIDGKRATLGVIGRGEIKDNIVQPGFKLDGISISVKGKDGHR